MCYGDNEDCTVDCSASRRRRSALRSARDTALENTDDVPMQENGLPGDTCLVKYEMLYLF